ncbi:hypothetical protein SAMN02745704_00676 [Paucidesulfovibrio gracilis DSM 16080]|uniref:Uncharacterized protein n=1 Tax=Paucidesulfovibrio gracilis DSM 16080 TaxID=1121449 RepID=A0A1T4WAZ7_9BACT|nr:hypothetical protein SAMN02745704_00676 [Paucidesulfovibrio gracilis DSM 16080]
MFKTVVTVEKGGMGWEQSAAATPRLRNPPGQHTDQDQMSDSNQTLGAFQLVLQLLDAFQQIHHDARAHH